MITHDEALRYLQQVPDSYRYTTLPCVIDDKLRAVVAFVKDASPEQRREFYRQIDTPSSYTLLAFAERMSMLCVRRGSVDLLRDGLIAVAMMGPESDSQLIAITVSLLYNSALKLNTDVVAIFEQAVHYRNEFSSAGGDVLSFLDREGRARSIEAMGHREVQGPSGLIYWAGNDPIPEGLLDENALSESVLLEDLQSFFDEFFVDPLYNGQYEPVQEAFDHLAPEERDRIEKKLLDALNAGSHEPRVFLGLGGLGSQKAIPRLHKLFSTATDSYLIDVSLALWSIEGNPGVIARIIQVLEQGASDSDRRVAAIALRRFHCQEVVQALQRALSDEDNYVRYEAAESLLSVCDLPPSKIDIRSVTPRLMSTDPTKWQEVLDEFLALSDPLMLPQCSTCKP
ncbi:MAG: HEAT repeat domain-containing protein [Anaerolineae bacterium]|nr:HEAT repeat domain-containing protein [Anaerolineae bacterium]